MRVRQTSSQAIAMVQLSLPPSAGMKSGRTGIRHAPSRRKEFRIYRWLPDEGGEADQG
jgi:hypothetical protein